MLLGTTAYDKLKGIILKKSILNDVKKLSSDAQTSTLEGFHSTLNQWHPKMICFSWLGTYCRRYLISSTKIVLEITQYIIEVNTCGSNEFIPYLVISYL